jgi:hypothetical protein
MINPVSINDVGLFLNNILSAFGTYVYYSFCMIIAFSIAFFIKSLIVGSR